jgi:hypothetical protein
MEDRAVLSEDFRPPQLPVDDQADGRQSENGHIIAAKTARDLRQASRHWQLPRGARHFRGKKRQSVVCLLLGLFIGVVLIREVNPLSRPRLTRANFAKIQTGMTLAQVEAILGAPPGDYTGGRCEPADKYAPSFGKVSPFLGFWGSNGSIEAWTTYEAYIAVGFDGYGRARVRHFDDVVSVTRSGNFVWVNPPRKYFDWVLGVLGL